MDRAGDIGGARPVRKAPVWAICVLVLAGALAIRARYLITRADASNTIPAMKEIIGHPRFRPLVRYPVGETSLLVYRILPATTPPRPR